MSAPLLVLLLLAARAPAQDPGDEEPAGAERRRWSFAPDEVLYPGYVADPRRATFGLSWIGARDSDIVGAGDSRYGVRMGARFGIAQLASAEQDGGALELAGDVGMLAQFDRDNSTDNLGWDGIYGFHLAWRTGPRLAVRVGMAHDSSHLGDEYIESTGRERIEYTREEWLAGVRFAPIASLASYVEYGHAYDLRNEELMEEGRVQLGLEFLPETRLWHPDVAPFAALDVSAFEEDDWEENVTVQLGVALVRAGRDERWRVGLELYDGRSPIGVLPGARAARGLGVLARSVKRSRAPAHLCLATASRVAARTDAGCRSAARSRGCCRR
jgi:hypothetical protein